MCHKHVFSTSHKLNLINANSISYSTHYSSISTFPNNAVSYLFVNIVFSYKYVYESILSSVIIWLGSSNKCSFCEEKITLKLTTTRVNDIFWKEVRSLDWDNFSEKNKFNGPNQKLTWKDENGPLNISERLKQ